MTNSFLALFTAFSLIFQVAAPAAILITRADQILEALVDRSTEEAQTTTQTCQEEDNTTIHERGSSISQRLVVFAFGFRLYLDVTSSHTQTILVPPPELSA